MGSKLKQLMAKENILVEQSEDILCRILCDVPGPHCYFGECDKCPNEAVLKDFVIEIFNKNHVENVTYKTWVSKPRATLETTEQTIAEFVEVFVKSAKLFLHSFIAKQQAEFYNKSIENLQNDTCVIVCDFAENYAFVI